MHSGNGCRSGGKFNYQPNAQALDDDVPHSLWKAAISVTLVTLVNLDVASCLGVCVILLQGITMSQYRS